MQFTSSGTHLEPIVGLGAFRHKTDEIDALTCFYRAFNTRDLELMSEIWLNSDESIMVSPLGGIARGWPEIRTAYERIFSAARVEIELHDYTVHIVGSLFFAVGRERGFFHARNIKLEFATRVTRVFRLEIGRWQQIHHHGSMEDAHLLKSCQAAMRLSGS